MHCPSCNHDNSAERRFCGECGAALVAMCAACGASNGPREKFCGSCGARLPVAPAAPTIAVSASVPEPDAALPAGERRQLTVLFCDLVGSTPLSQQLDAEEWRDLIAQYQQAAAGAVTRFGGHVAKNLGDGLLIYFGWPTAREDDPQRAVRAGLAIVEAVRALNERLHPDPPPLTEVFAEEGTRRGRGLAYETPGTESIVAQEPSQLLQVPSSVARRASANRASCRC